MSQYRRVFSEGLLEIYPVCAGLRKRADLFLRVNEPEKTDRSKLIFYLLMAVVCTVLRTPKARIPRLKSLVVDSITDAHFGSALSVVRKIYENRGASDRAAKGPDMVADLRTEMRRIYGQGRKIKTASPGAD